MKNLNARNASSAEKKEKQVKRWRFERNKKEKKTGSVVRGEDIRTGKEMKIEGERTEIVKIEDRMRTRGNVKKDSERTRK